MCSFFFIMILYLDLKHPKQLSKSMSKLTGLHTIFSKNSIYCVNIGFRALMFARSLGRCLKTRKTDLVATEGHLISQSYMDELLRSVVLPLLCENQ